MKVVVIGPNLPNQSKGSFHVHEASCADIERNREYRSPDFGFDRTHPYEMDSRMDVTTFVYPPSDFDYDPTDASDSDAYLSDIYFFPCTSDLD